MVPAGTPCFNRVEHELEPYTSVAGSVDLCSPCTSYAAAEFSYRNNTSGTEVLLFQTDLNSKRSTPETPPSSDCRYWYCSVITSSSAGVIGLCSSTVRLKRQ